MKKVAVVFLGILFAGTTVYAGNGDLNVSGNVTATSLVTSRGAIATNETTTYGNLQVSGNKSGYFGIRSSDFGRTFMFNAGYSGIYKDTGAWSWYFDDNGVLVMGSVPGGNVTGTVANATNAGGLAVASGRNIQANQIVRTNASGYLDTGYINMQADSNNASPTYVAGQTNNDNYLRWYNTAYLNVNYAASAGNVSGGQRIPWAAKPAFRGALIYTSSTYSLASNTIVLGLNTYGTTVYDTDSIANGARNLVVPTGVSKVRVLANIGSVSPFGTPSVLLLRIDEYNSGGSYVRTVCQQNTHMSADYLGAQTVAVNITSPVLNATSGNYYIVVVRQISGGTMTVSASNQNWFAMEIVE